MRKTCKQNHAVLFLHHVSYKEKKRLILKTVLNRIKYSSIEQLVRFTFFFQINVLYFLLILKTFTLPVHISDIVQLYLKEVSI